MQFFDITKHNLSANHKAATSAYLGSQKVDAFFPKSTIGDFERQLALAEAVYCYHIVNHNQPFRSMDCLKNIIQKTFQKKFSCKRTKSEAVVKNVLAIHAMKSLVNQMKNASFITISTDSSNHKDTKLFPTVIRFFDKTYGVQVKLLDFTSLKNETSDTISENLKKIIDEYKINQKVIGFCADNTNTNFGGKRRGTDNNVFRKMQNFLNKPIVGVGCHAHIINNAIQTASDAFPVDIDAVVGKIYSHFYIYTVRTESLKEFCDGVDIQYRKLLCYSKTRWLSLFPALERILKLFEPIKSYFNN